MASRRPDRKNECHVCGRTPTSEKKVLAWRHDPRLMRQCRSGARSSGKQQPYEDWYVDSSFLEQLRTNGTTALVSLPISVLENVREYDYWGMTKSSAALTQQMSLVLIFFVRSLLRG